MVCFYLLHLFSSQQKFCCFITLFLLSNYLINFKNPILLSKKYWDFNSITTLLNLYFVLSLKQSKFLNKDKYKVNYIVFNCLYYVIET